jgi:hypothetical protein
MTSEDRIGFLRQYVRGCLQSGLLKKEDLVSGEIVHKLASIISRDMRVVGRELVAEGIGGLARLGVMALAGIAEKAGRQK